MDEAAFSVIFDAATNKVLLLRSRTNPKYQLSWSLPGGLVEPGESPAIAAAREAMEEVGIETNISQVLVRYFSEESQLMIT